MNSVVSRSTEETMRIAKEFAKSTKRGDVICLYGNLGAGKTHFVKGFVQAFGLTADEVNSPTFTIINEYPGTVPVYHFDCYRLKNSGEAVEIGTEEYFFADGVCIIEWPEKIRDLLPHSAKSITLKTISQQERQIIFHQ